MPATKPKLNRKAVIIQAPPPPPAKKPVAKVIPIKPLTAWSFSRYQTYKTCPLKARYSFIDRIKEPGNPAMDRGAQIHTLAEQFIKGDITKLPPELKLFNSEFKRLKALFKKEAESMVVEDSWAFTKDWDETVWNDWVGCWVRIKLDCAHHASDTVLVVTDWKTGKFRAELNEEYVEQLELYALGALLLHKHLEEVRPRLVYLDQDRVYPNGTDEPELVFTRADITRLKALWAKRTKAMMNDTTFAPRPNDKCHWCFYGQSGKAKGGPGLCKY